jgi:hypothetical protein
MSDKNWIANVVRKADTPAKIARLLLQYPEYLTDGYYRSLGQALTEQAEKVLKAHDHEQRALKRKAKKDAGLVLGQCGECYGINRHEPNCNLKKK